MLNQKKISRAGSVTIPAHLRRELGLEPGEVLDVSHTNKGDIVLKRSRGFCLFCKSDRELVMYDGRFVCKTCIDRMKRRPTMFEVIDTQPKEIAALISRAVTLDSEIQQRKTALEEIKAKLQTAALAEMENKNLRYVRYDSLYGSVEMTYKTKLEIDNYARLAAALDASVLVEDKIVRRQSVKYDIDARFKAALIALARGDYAAHDIDGILLSMGIEDAQMRKVVRKKLKGDYAKDKEVLASVGIGGDREEELDAIREELNRQLVERFFEPDLVDRDEVRNSVNLDESLSLTLMARKGDGQDVESAED